MLLTHVAKAVAVLGPIVVITLKSCGPQALRSVAVSNATAIIEQTTDYEC